MFKNPFSFEGRIRRLEYGLSLIIFYAAILVFILIGTLLDRATAFENVFEPIFCFAALLAGSWLTIAQATKRCHDLGHSGWWQLIPLYGIMLLFGESDFGPNEYGLNPKNRGNDVNFGFEQAAYDHPADAPYNY